MKTVLEAETEIRIVTAVAELAVWRERPELQLLCASAREHGALGEQEIAEILPGVSRRGRENILRRLEHDRLLDRNRNLTDFGERCARSGAAPAWEQGAYRFLVACHPFFESRLLDFERFPRRGEPNCDDSEPIRGALATVAGSGRVFASAFDSSKRFSVGKFPAKLGQDPLCRIESVKAGKLRWEIDLLSGANEWTIEGRVGEWRPPGEFRGGGGSEAQEDTIGFFPDWEPRWSEVQRGRVAVRYDGKAGREGRETFTRDRSYGPVRAGRFGDVQRAVVRDVPVGPATEKDARLWATAIALARVEAEDAYTAPDGWRHVWMDSTRKTPLEEWAGDAPDPAALSQEHGRLPTARTKWLLAAAADLEASA